LIVKTRATMRLMMIRFAVFNIVHALLSCAAFTLHMRLVI